MQVMTLPQMATPTATHEVGARRLGLDRNYLVILLLPFVLLVVSTDWLYPTTLNNIDSWLYYGYLHNTRRQIHNFPGQYFPDRLPWLVPAYVFHHYLPTLAAHWALKLSYLGATLLAFYRLAKYATNSRAALLATIMFACYPVTLNSAGWYYVDSAAVCYCLLAMSCLLAAALAEGLVSWLWSSLAGVLLAGMLVTYPLEIVLVPSLLVFFWVAARATHQRGMVSRFFFTNSFMAVGATGFVLVLIGIWHYLTGDWHFFNASLDYILHRQQKEAAVWLEKGWSWVYEAFWLTFPIAVSLGSFAALASAAARRGWGNRPIAIFFLANTPAVAILLVLLRQWKGVHLLDHSHHPFLLTPIWFLGLAPLMSEACSRLSTRGFIAVTGLTLLLFAVPMTIGFEKLFRPVSVSYWHTLSHLEGCNWLSPVLWLTGVLAFLCMSIWRRSSASLAAFVVALAVISAAGVAPYYACRWHASTGGAEAFRGVTNAAARIEQVIGGRHAWVWFSKDDPRYGNLISLSSSRLAVLRRWYNEEAPALSAPLASGIAPGEIILILSSSGGEQLEGLSRKTLEGYGVQTRLLAQEELPFGPSRLRMAFLEVFQRRF
jgi:hypothetical protein